MRFGWIPGFVAALGLAVAPQPGLAEDLPDGLDVRINVRVEGNPSRPSLTVDANSFTVFWESDAPAPGLFAQRFSFSGERLGGESRRAMLTTPATALQEAALEDGSVLVFEAYGLDGDGWGVFAQLHDGADMPLGDAVQVNRRSAGAQRSPVVAAIPHGFVVVWESADGDGTGIFGRLFADDLIFYAWDFGNGQSSSGLMTPHTYTVEGTYVVTLTVTDVAGRQGTASATVIADPMNFPPIASFAATPTSGHAPLIRRPTQAWL